jgi:hypothetical protein
LRKILTEAGFGTNYSSHSLRKGIIQELKRRGVDTNLIKHLVNWTGDNYDTYGRLNSTDETRLIYEKLTRQNKTFLSLFIQKMRNKQSKDDAME